MPLRQSPSGIAYLACLLDEAGVVHEWLELWVQRFDATASGAAGRVDGNAARDLAFDAWRQALASADSSSVLTLRAPITPIELNRRSGHSAPQLDGTWALCKDDAALDAAGLPAYTTSSVRYLRSVVDGAAAFIALSDDAPVDDRSKSFAEVAHPAPDLIPFNTECGHWFATRWLPASLEEHLALIEGETWTPPLHGRTPIPTDATAVAIRQQDMKGSASLFLMNRSPQQRLAEALHLKLLALRAAVNAVAAATRASGRPLLSVHLDSFRVGYSLAADFTPVLWSAQVELVTPSDAVELPADATGRRMFACSDATRGSVFAADAATAPRSGRVNVRIRQSTLERGLGHIVEATLSTVEPLAAARGDDLWLSILTTAGPVALLGSIEVAGADRSFRFRSRPVTLTDEQATFFEQSAGVAMRDVPFELLRTRGSPSDLYSLGVLGLRCLFGGTSAPSLGVAVDELVAMSQAEAPAGEEPAETFIALFANDAVRRERMGPRFLLRQPVDANDAFDAIPTVLWAGILATISRMFSGTTAHCTCPDLVGNGGDASVFDRVLSELAGLIVQTRSLVLNELHYNRRVSRVIDSLTNDRATRAARSSS